MRSSLTSTQIPLPLKIYQLMKSKTRPTHRTPSRAIQCALWTKSHPMALSWPQMTLGRSSSRMPQVSSPLSSTTRLQITIRRKAMSKSSTKREKVSILTMIHQSRKSSLSLCLSARIRVAVTLIVSRDMQLQTLRKVTILERALRRIGLKSCSQRSHLWARVIDTRSQNLLSNLGKS